MFLSLRTACPVIANGRASLNPPKLGGNLSLDTHRPWPLFAIGRSSNLGEDGLGSGTKTVGGKTSTTNPLWANQFLPWREAYSADPLFRRSAVPLLWDTTVTQILHYPFPAPLLYPIRLLRHGVVSLPLQRSFVGQHPTIGMSN